MTPLDALAIFATGLAAGTINTVVGSGSLITFPTLLALGYPAVLANVSNNIGLVPGSVSGVVGYRRELIGQRGRILRLAIASLAGGIVGAHLLLSRPGLFRQVVPVLILVACALVIFQPRLTRRLGGRHGEDSSRIGALLMAGVLVTGIYGGYFGAAQGVILITLLAIFLEDDLQRLNGTKNVLALLVNGVATIVFLVRNAPVNWAVVGIIAAGSIVGGQLGATVGRRLPGPALRTLIIVVGLTAATVLMVR